MTRDEAMDRLRAETDSACSIRWMEDFVDSAVALGMLKLEEPPSLTQKIHMAMCDSGYAFLRSDDFKECMEKHGLKIVEK